MNEKVLEAKKAVVNELNEHLKNSKCAIIVTYHSLPVSLLTQLRKGLKGVGAKIEVHKNTLARRALDAEGYQALEPLLVGPNALITSPDATAALPVLTAFAQKNKALEIKGAVIDGSFCDASKLADLGKVGTKENALAMLCGALQSPIRNFAYGLKSYAEKEQN